MKTHAIALAALLTIACAVQADPLTNCANVSGKVKGRADDGSAISLAVSAVTPAACQANGQIVSVAVTDPLLKTRVKDVSRDDGVKIDLKVEGTAASPVVSASDFEWLTIPLGPPLAAVMIAFLLALLALTFILSKNLRGLLLIGADNRYSNSKTQMTLWFFATFVVYLSAYFLRWRGGYTDHISIPQNLILLSGMSALTGAAAMLITSQKQAAAQSQGATPKAKAPAPKFPGDLLRADDGSFDLGDYQMILIMLIALATYLVTAVGFLGRLEQRVAVSLPDIDGAMATLLGIGQAAYLTKKAGSDINH